VQLKPWHQQQGNWKPSAACQWQLWPALAALEVPKVRQLESLGQLASRECQGRLALSPLPRLQLACLPTGCCW